MNDVAVLVRERTTPRKRDAEATRAAILEAAKAQFARAGYHAALRDIAAEAGCDVALIKRYFGGKEALFTEALKASIHGERFATMDRTTFAREAAALMAGHAHDDEERTHAFQFLLRTATSPATAPLLNEAVQQRFLDPIRDWLGGAGAAADARARLLAAVYIGLLVERLIRDEPLKGAEREAFIDRTAAVLDAVIHAP